MSDTPIYTAVTNFREVSIKEGRNLERADLLEWFQKQKTKTVKVEEIVKMLRGY